VARARADSARYPYTAADVRFMSAMIGHHSQAVAIANWAPTHGASAAVRTLAARIVNGQADEIATMRRWLADRGQLVPDSANAMGAAAMHRSAGAAPAAGRGAHDMAGHGAAGHDSGGQQMAAHHAEMPGMLTVAQLDQLDRARGDAFDRLFLTLMIRHHQGAVAMVRSLFGTPAAGQDETVFKFASDVQVDQITEITRMQQMLAAVTFGSASP
jgi:uncharacterized protein (DUF305 family)